MFPKVGAASNGLQTQTLVDDAASSICVDTQDYLELDKAFEVLQDQEENEPQTDFERYNQMVARRMVLDREFDDKTVDLESIADLEDLSGISFPVFSPHIRYDMFKFMVLGGCMSVVTLFQLQEALSRDGPLGITLGAIIGIGLYYVAVNGIVEMMAFHPLEGGYGAYVEQYFNESLGFGFNVTYWINCVTSAPLELVVSLLMLTQFETINTPDLNWIIWLVYFCAILLFMQMTTKYYHVRLMWLGSLVSVVLSILILLFMLLLSTGKLGPKYEYIGFKLWHKDCGSQFGCGTFQTRYGDLKGSAGRFFQVLDAVMCTFRCTATVDKVYALMPQVRNPRKSIRNARIYHLGRLILVIFMPALCMAITANMNDPLLHMGKAVPSIEEPQKTRMPPNAQLSTQVGSCIVEFSKWKGFTGLRTFLPVSVPFLREGVCQMNKYVAAAYIFFGINACVFYLMAATQTMTGVSLERPFRIRPYNKRHYYILLNSVICIALCVLNFLRLDTVYRFFATFQNSYIYGSCLLLNWTYLRFYKSVKLQTDGYIDRDDREWPFRAPWGLYTAYSSIVTCVILGAGQYFIYAGPVHQWGGTQFFGCNLSIIIFAIAAGAHWLKYRTQNVDPKETNLAASKRALDEQEWIEDRFFRSKIWLRVDSWLSLVKYWLFYPLRAAAALWHKQRKGKKRI